MDPNQNMWECQGTVIARNEVTTQSPPLSNDYVCSHSICHPGRDWRDPDTRDEKK